MPNDCDYEKRRYPLQGVEVALFLIDYLECKVLLVLASDYRRPIASYCATMVDKRDNVALVKPNKTLGSFNGVRLSQRIETVHDEIWLSYIVPGSGLVLDK